MFEPVKDKPTWIANTHLHSIILPEPPFVQKYVGGQRVDIEEQYEHLLSDAALESAARSGATLIWVHFFQGFGLEYEKPEADRLRDFAQRAHSRNLKVAFRVTLGSLTPETLLNEEAESLNWLQVNHEGQLCAALNRFSARPCLNSEAYLRYIERVCHSAIDCGADIIHFGDTGFNPEPDTCHCPLCVTAFREFLRRQYGAQNEQTKQAGFERFGHNSVIHVRPPAYRAHAKKAPADGPHQQEWIRFKAHTLTQALSRLTHAIAKRNPACAVGADLLADASINTDARWGVNYVEQLPHVQAVLSEPDLLPDASGVKSLCLLHKIARAFNVALLTSPANQMLPLETRLATSVAFGQHGHAVLETPADMINRTDDSLKTLRDFAAYFEQHKMLLGQSVSLATVGIFRDTPSLAFGSNVCQNEVEDDLLENHISFDLLFESDLKKLQNYRCILLPDAESLSNDLAQAFEAYVNAGGGLVIIDDLGTRDPWRRTRQKPVLSGLLGHPDEVEVDYVCRQVGQGRVAFLQESEILPARYAEVIAYASGREIPCMISCNSGQVISECRKLGDFTAIHVINPNAKPARGIRFSIACENSPQKVVPVSPAQQYEPIPFTCDNGRLHFVFDEIPRYVMFRIDF